MGLEAYFLVGFGILVLIVSAHISTKIIDWHQKRKDAEFKNDKAQFMADLYILQQKWAKKGEVEYSRSIGMIIDAHNLPDEESSPETEYGKELKRSLNQ